MSEAPGSPRHIGFTLQDITEESWKQHFTGSSHVTLYCVFRNSAGDLVEPQTNLSTVIKYDGAPVTTVKTMVPLKRLQDNDAPSQPGKFIYQFLTTDLASGDYTVEFRGRWTSPTKDVGGEYPSEDLLITGSFTLVDIPVEQEMIHRLRVLLNDNGMRRYLLDDPRKFFWENGELYQFLHMSLDAHNNAPPVTPGKWDFNTFPYLESLLIGGMVYALSSRGVLEIANTLQYNDELSLTIDRQPKYQNHASWLATAWIMNLRMWKLDWSFHANRWVGLKSLKLPFTILRPLSLRDEMQNTFGGLL